MTRRGNSPFRATSGMEVRPILISTSSIALQNAVWDEYLPLLSSVLMEDGLAGQPIQAVIRKGKSHYVCDERLENQLGQLDLSKKNWRAGAALLTLRGQLDTDEDAHLSGYDRARVCVPPVCDCRREGCRYLAFLESCDTGQFLFQVCNHNLLLAAESLWDATAALLRKPARPPEDRPFEHYARSLATPARSLTVIRKQLHGLLTPPTHRHLETVSSAVPLFRQGRFDLVFYTAEDGCGGAMLCAII